MDFDQSMILDATRGSIARFVNHSCDPNCRMAKWTVHGKPRMALFAGDHGIMTGEELTYDYNFNPFSIKNIQQCRCGAANCRGVLGPKPKEAKEKELREALNPIAGGGKRKIQQAVEDAVEGVKNVAKKRKLNIPVPVSLKNAVNKAKQQVQGKPEEKAKKGAKPKLPIGWVYTAELDEPPPPVVRNIFANDPEALLRSQKRKAKAESEEASSLKKRRTTSGETLTNENSGRRSSEKVKLEDEEEGRPSMSRKDSVKAKANSVRKNVVRTLKGRQGGTPGTPGRRSIRVIEDEEIDFE